MKHFDTTRFMNYGRYDCAINKTYYRNMSLVAILVIVGLALVGFLGRWGFWKLSGGNTSEPMTDYHQAPLTSAILYAAVSMLTLVFAGCTFHNLRTKQRRIFELTMPATKLEKYTWHVLTSIVGGLVVCFIGLGLADGMNALLHLLVYQDAPGSLIAKMFEAVTLGAVRGLDSNADTVFTSFSYGVFAYAFMNLGWYVLVNSFKYRFNILIAYGIQQGVFMLFYIIAIIIGICGGFNGMTPTGAAWLGYVFAALFVILGVLFFWGAYKRFGKAVITSGMNK